ncbi:MAG: class I SAM-dependent methyltransferase [Verrucomicrobiota bacterium]|nr:class I SAM-dependent methyltransferase [Verrucomicrobiota bacterium]
MKELTFEDFKELARDQSLTAHEKIGFPNSYREGKEEVIFADIRRKLPNLEKAKQVVIDIGAGCSGLAFRMIDWCRLHQHQLVLIDSEEMLAHLPEEAFITKVAGRYPEQCADVFEKFANQANAILCYSVLHYIYAETNLFSFLDKSLSLLAHGGEMLIGDIPNVSMRKRFFSSPRGIQFHKEFTGKDETPEVQFNTINNGKIDDSVLLSLVARARNSGSDAYLLPQSADLPMANRREDLLIQKP